MMTPFEDNVLARTNDNRRERFSPEPAIYPNPAKSVNATITPRDWQVQHVNKSRGSKPAAQARDIAICHADLHDAFRQR
jgi:hypothetical protein